MKAIRSHHLSRSTCLTLVVILVSSLAAPWLSVAWAQAAPKTVLVFPAAVSAENPSAGLGEHATGALTMALADLHDYDAMQFSSTSPSVRRAVSEGRIREVDVQEGVSAVGTALSMGAALRADYVVLSTVQSYTRKDNPSAVEVILAGQMYAVAPNLNPTTGEPVGEPKVYRAFGVSGASTQRAKFNGREAVLAQEALRDAAFKAAQTLSGRTDVGQVGMKKKSDSTIKWLLVGLLIAGAAVAMGNQNHGDSGVAENRPVTNVIVTTQDGSNRVTWSPPTGTTLRVLQYQVYRRVAPSTTYVRQDSGELVDGVTTFTDSNLVTGPATYFYRVRVAYTNGALSAFTDQSGSGTTQ